VAADADRPSVPIDGRWPAPVRNGHPVRGPIHTEVVPYADLAVATGWLLVVSIPLALTAWAFLDAAKRPRWAWALSQRRQLVWLVALGAGVMSLLPGILVSVWYLVRVRPAIAAVERGELPPVADHGRGDPDA
jgi:hypothetical protein